MFSRFKVFGEPRSSTFQQQSWKTQKQQDIHTKKGSKNDDPTRDVFPFPVFLGLSHIHLHQENNKPPFKTAVFVGPPPPKERHCLKRTLFRWRSCQGGILARQCRWTSASLTWHVKCSVSLGLMMWAGVAGLVFRGCGNTWDDDSMGFWRTTVCPRQDSEIWKRWAVYDHLNSYYCSQLESFDHIRYTPKHSDAMLVFIGVTFYTT